MEKINKRLNIHENPQLSTSTEVRILLSSITFRDTFKQVLNLQVIRKIR